MESLSKCNSLTSLANIVLPKTLVILDIGTGMLEDCLAELGLSSLTLRQKKVPAMSTAMTLSSP